MNQNMNRIRELRHKRGLSLQQLADASGTSKSQIDKLEKGNRRLTVDWMVRLARPLGCDPRDLLPSSDAKTRACVPVYSPAMPSAELLVFALKRGRKKEMILTREAVDKVPRPHYLAHAKDAYALYVVDKTMVPMYRPRQLLFVNPYKPPSPGGGAIVVLTSGAVLIREFLKQKQDGIAVRVHHPRQRIAKLALASIAAVHAIVGTQEPG